MTTYNTTPGPIVVMTDVDNPENSNVIRTGSGDPMNPTISGYVVTAATSGAADAFTGITAGTAAASKAVVLNSSKGITTITSATITTLTSTTGNITTTTSTTSNATTQNAGAS